MASVMAPFRALLKSSAQFYWDDNLQNLFERAKEEIVEKIKIIQAEFNRKKRRKKNEQIDEKV